MGRRILSESKPSMPFTSCWSERKTLRMPHNPHGSGGSITPPGTPLYRSHPPQYGCPQQYANEPQARREEALCDQLPAAAGGTGGILKREYMVLHLQSYIYTNLTYMFRNRTNHLTNAYVYVYVKYMLAPAVGVSTLVLVVLLLLDLLREPFDHLVRRRPPPPGGGARRLVELELLGRELPLEGRDLVLRVRHDSCTRMRSSTHECDCLPTIPYVRAPYTGDNDNDI